MSLVSDLRNGILLEPRCARVSGNLNNPSRSIFIIMLPALSRFRNPYTTEVQKRLKPCPEDSVVREEDLAYLPGPVRNYLHFVGAVGKPKVCNFRAEGSGSLKRSPGSRWMDIAVQQYNFFDDPARLYYVRSSLFGIPFDGLHAYLCDNATMKINVAYFLPVIDAGGEKMMMSETVTLFNDMCLLAPATLISSNVLWETVDPLSVWARFTHNGITVAAMLYFRENGGMARFVSDDRYMAADGKTFARYQWSTLVGEYRDFNGRKVPVYGEAAWQMPEGAFTYARFMLKEIEYNCPEFR
jgi:hypothetical protein